MKIDFRPAEIFRGTQLFRQADNLAYAYETSHSAADADGAPNAYHPGDLNKNCQKAKHIGLDCLSNAGYPRSSWWRDVLVPDPNDPSKAFVQPDGPFAGYFVAMTSLRAPKGKKYDPATYVDATKIPYVVIPTGFEKLPHVAQQGDVGIATHLASGKVTAFIVGDSGGGGTAKLGEASIALFVALGGTNPNPRTGAGLPRGMIQYVLFPGSRKAGAAIWPRPNDDIRSQAIYLASHTPGIDPETTVADAARRARTPAVDVPAGTPEATAVPRSASRKRKRSTGVPAADRSTVGSTLVTTRKKRHSARKRTRRDVR